MSISLSEFYTWQATMPDGSLRTEGGDLSGAVMVSLIPHEKVIWPRHDFTGLDFERRFGRGLLRGMGGGMKEYLHCVVTRQCRIYLKSSNGAIVITPPDYELYL